MSRSNILEQKKSSQHVTRSTALTTIQVENVTLHKLQNVNRLQKKSTQLILGTQL